jgi:hypothetical protein
MSDGQALAEDLREEVRGGSVHVPEQGSERGRSHARQGRDPARGPVCARAPRDADAQCLEPGREPHRDAPFWVEDGSAPAGIALERKGGR